MTKINFIIPIKNPQRILDKKLFVRLLSETIASIERQKQDLSITLSISPGTPLPSLSDRVRIVVNEDAPEVTASAPESQESYFSMVRADKGRRVAAAIDAIRDGTEFVMVVDDDDLVHPELSCYLHEHNDAEISGFVLEQGYRADINTGAMARLDRFHMTCGTSLIVRRNRYRYRPNLGARARAKAISELGSHIILPRTLAKKDDALRPVPFPAAIYRTGSSNATQQEIGKFFGVRNTVAHRKSAQGVILDAHEVAAVRKEFMLT